MSQTKTVYVVEDSTIIARILTNVISELPGVRVINFQTGESMLDTLAAEKPDLILLDYYLDAGQKNVMNGAAVIVEVKQLFPDMKVVMLTGMHDDHKIEEIKKLGFEEILHKDADDVLVQVVECVQRHL